MITKAEAARLERIARIEEHRAAFYAECVAKYQPPSVLRQALDTVPDSHPYLCGGRLRVEVTPETLAACQRALDELDGRRAAIAAFDTLRAKLAGKAGR